MALNLIRLPVLTALVGIGALFGFLIFIYVVERFILGVRLPSNIALIREPEGARRFSLRTRLAYYTDCKALFREAFDQYLNQGKPVVIPGLGIRREVLLPSSSIRWALAQPESKLGVGVAFAEMDQTHWSLGYEEIITDPWAGMLVKTDFNRIIEPLSAAMYDELGIAIDQQYGTDTENWREIDLLPTNKVIIAQAAARFTVGAPLCRDREYNDTVLELNDLLLLNAGVTGAFPKFVQPLVGPLVNIQTRHKVNKIEKWLIPEWKRRIETLKHAPDDPQHDEPQDYLQLIVRYAANERPKELHDYGFIVRRLVATNFGSVHQTSLQMTNLLLNIVGSDAEFNTVAGLRDEAARIMGPHLDAPWTKARVSQMVRADSVSRENMRLCSFGGRAIMRKVVADGFATEDGYDLPKGTMVSFLGQAAQTDEGTFEDALKYDPFRFSRIREAAAARDEQAPSLTFVSTSAEHLPFGHGKHACPGRFITDFELKMISAYVLGNYDLKFPDAYGGRRPPNKWMAEAQFPPDGARLLVRRRKA